MPSTSFRLPTAAREEPTDGASGSGVWSNVNNALLADGSYAICDLPDGSTYSPGPTEIDRGHLCPSGILLNNFGFSAELPANAVVTGITIQTILFSDYTESEQNINYYLQFCKFPDEVAFNTDIYYLFENKFTGAPKSDTSVQTVGGAGDVWQPNPNLTKDGMFMYSTDASFPGYEVQTSTLDPTSSDVFYNGHDILIQPTTQGYSGSYLDASGSFATFNFAPFLAGGGSVTVSFPASIFPPTTFVAQAGPATPGDATFQCVIDNDISLQSLSNQINFHPDTSNYVSSNIFTGAQIWSLSSIDIGSYTNGITISSNIPASFDFPNGGQFIGGLDPDPNISTMNSNTASPLITNAGGPIIARVDGSNATTLQITNTVTNFTLKHSVAASVFRDPRFGIILFYDWVDSDTGDPLLYPEIPDNQQKLDYVKVSLTYELVGGGLLLLGVG